MKNPSKNLVIIRGYLDKMSYIKFICFIVGFLLLKAVLEFFIFYGLSSYFSEFYEGESDKTFMNITLLFIYGAVTETLMFQGILFWIFRFIAEESSYGLKKGINSPVLYIMITSILFGLYHIIAVIDRNIITIFLRVFFATITGIVFSASFYILHRKRRMPLLSVSLIHFLYNEIIYGLPYLLGL